MKTLIKLLGRLGIRFEYHLQIRVFKRVSFSLPDAANDVHLRQPSTGEWATREPDKPDIVYYIGCTKYCIDVPPCKYAKQVCFTPRLSNNIIDGKRTYNTNRTITIDLFY